MSSGKSQPGSQSQLGSRGDSGHTDPVEPNDDSATKSPTAVDEETETEELDEWFSEMFLGETKTYANVQEIDQPIEDYEQASGFRLIIQKSEPFARKYKCVSHVGCCFRAKFGRVRSKDWLVVKRSKASTYPYHKGALAPSTSKGGRARKTRLKHRIEQIVEKVSLCKDGQLRPKDVLEAAADTESFMPTYNQSYRAIQRSADTRREQEKLSFQSIIPFLQKFMAQNPGSTTSYEMDADNHLTRVFVCPGIMQSAIRFVRPVMTLDAVPLKSSWKGTLYTATVMTGCNDLYPVAFSIMHEEPNESGWIWFLELLRSAIDMLVMDHPKEGVDYKYFSFISNCEKGLVQAVTRVFPQNYFCVAGTTPHPWIKPDAPGLPPRYGIVASNWNESTNPVFEMSLEGSWLRIMDDLLMKMLENICTLRDKHKAKTGVVQDMADELTEHWENSMGFKVCEIQENGDVFCVMRQGRRGMETTTSYSIDVVNMTCECGKWQELGVPCIHALAYYRLHKEVSLNYIFDHLIDKYYTHENERELLKKGIFPVCMDHIIPDGSTLPPKPPTPLVSEQPKKQRIRKRSRFAHDPEKSTIVCSRCRKRGHNVRTCIAREAMEKNGDNSSWDSHSEDEKMDI